MNNVEMTDTELEKLFREWWKESYPTPPGTHALITHLGWGRHLLNHIKHKQQNSNYLEFPDSSILASVEEVSGLVLLIRQIALAWEPDVCLLGNMTAGQLARAADLLEQGHAVSVPNLEVAS